MTRAASRFVHYLHGTNPLSIVYLTNMYRARRRELRQRDLPHLVRRRQRDAGIGRESSTYGPPPGYLTGGPNPSYDWDGCCPSGCGSTGQQRDLHVAESISPPKGQPAQKSYKDFNTGWPLDSWSVTEPSDGYQVAYIRLLSKFVR